MAADAESQLVEAVAALAHDPLGFSRFAFPWGEGELAGHDGPRPWQREVLADIGKHLREPGSRYDPCLVAVASGHGIGKSALIGQIIVWAMSTCDDCKVVVTANTENQLRTKTWPEISKWFRLSITGSWFNPTATAVAARDPAHERSWRADAVPWSDTNTEAFAGLHNAGKRIVLIFDEASAISDKVWEVAEGALTDENTEILWIAFGNPTRNSGRFREAFGRLRHRWKARQVDSRSVPGTNKRQIDRWVADYGEDSDFVRVRVRGLFPKAGSLQFIPSDLLDKAIRAPAAALSDDAVVVGVDVARFGDDQSVIRVRRGRDARSAPPVKLRGVDTMALAGRVASVIHEVQPDAVFVDETGVGGGVVDRLRQLGFSIIGVNFAAAADGMVDGERYANKRAEMYGRARAWLRTGGAIDDDPELRAGLEGVEYGYDADNRIQLERKSEMKKRGLASPDDADAFVLTFAYPVAPRVRGASRSSGGVVSDYNPYD